MDIQEDDDFKTIKKKMTKTATAATENIVGGDLGDGSAAESRLAAGIAKAFWGYALYDITGNERPKLTYGSINRRPVNSTEAGKLATSMLQEGIRRISTQTAIPVVVPRDKLLTEHRKETFLTMKDASQYPMLSAVVHNSVNEIPALGGQHRRDAMKANVRWADKTMKTAKDRLAANMAERALAERALKNENKKAHNQAQKRMEELTIELDRIEDEVKLAKTVQKWKGQWLVQIYVQGTILSSLRQIVC